MDTLDSPYLQDLASTPPDVLLSSKAPSTNLKYAAGWMRWKKWAACFGICVFPAAPMHVALYLRDTLKTAETVSPIECAVYSIAWAHNITGVSSTTQNPFVTSTQAGCKRLLAKPIVRKKAMQPLHMLDTFMDSSWPEMEDIKRSGVRVHVFLIIRRTIQISGLVSQTQNGCLFLLV